MARTVRNPKLDTRSARAKLKPRREPYWCSLAPGRAIGYRRLGPQGGTWIAKLRSPALGRRLHALGPADDALDAGDVILTFAAAQEKAREWFAELESAAGKEVTPSGPFTVGKAVHDYLDWIAKHRRPSTAREWRYVAEAHILPSLGEVEIADLTAQRIRSWHEALAGTPARLRTRLGQRQRYREPSEDTEALRARRATANRVLVVLKAALNRAFAESRVRNDEAWRRVKPFRGADAARLRYLSEDECRRLLNACPEDLRRLVRGALATGCRYGELCRAEVRDLSLEAGRLLVRESKAGKPRWVPLDDEGLAFLQTLAAGRDPTERLFLRADGKPWQKSHQARPLLEACMVARIAPPASFHILRHTWASHRVMRGMPLLVVAQVLGHADTRMVEKHYGHLAPSYVHDLVRRTALDLGPLEPVGVVALRSGRAG